ncbi:MAG: DUF2357 domain-containing protein, partial [Acutalibacteraceae bacterium]
MADRTDAKHLNDMERIYGDTKYFIEGITTGYGFYGDFIESMRNGSASVRINRKTLHKKIEEQWINAIEACLPALDTVTRNYSVGIEEREEVMPIEFSKNINSRSIRHLAQHTDYITAIEGDTVMPSKILNVFHEETMQTYENKFVNTLIQRLFSFVERRYSALKERGTEESGVQLDFNGAFNFGSSSGKISFNIEVDDPAGKAEEEGSFSRVARIREILLRYLESPFVKAMQGAYIRPPVMRTNAIVKNKHLSQCLDLWDYIESYEKVGYVIEVEEKAEKPSEEFIKELYSMLSLQYMIFDYNIHRGFNGLPEVLNTKQSEEPLSPNIVTRLQRIEADEYNVYDTEYRRVVNVSQLTGQRRL